MRYTNGPSLPGSPAITASSAPFGKAAGPGPHLRLSGAAITCSSAATVESGNSTSANAPMTVPTRVIAVPPSLRAFYGTALRPQDERLQLHEQYEFVHWP